MPTMTATPPTLRPGQILGDAVQAQYGLSYDQLRAAEALGLRAPRVLFRASVWNARLEATRVFEAEHVQAWADVFRALTPSGGWPETCGPGASAIARDALAAALGWDVATLLERAPCLQFPRPHVRTVVGPQGELRQLPHWRRGDVDAWLAQARLVSGDRGLSA